VISDTKIGLFLTIAFGLVAIIYALFGGLCWTDFSAIGSYFGAAFNLIFLIWIILTYRQQHKELQVTISELKRTNDENQRQTEILSNQEKRSKQTITMELLTKLETEMKSIVAQFHGIIIFKASDNNLKSEFELFTETGLLLPYVRRLQHVLIGRPKKANFTDEEKRELAFLIQRYKENFKDCKRATDILKSDDSDEFKNLIEACYPGKALNDFNVFTDQFNNTSEYRIHD